MTDNIKRAEILIDLSGMGQGTLYLDGVKQKGVRAVRLGVRVGKRNTLVVEYNVIEVKATGVFDVTSIDSPAKQVIEKK